MKRENGKERYASGRLIVFYQNGDAQKAQEYLRFLPINSRLSLNSNGMMKHDFEKENFLVQSGKFTVKDADEPSLSRIHLEQKGICLFKFRI